MKYFKKSILLLSIIVAFTVGCTKAQESLNSSFDVVEDGTQDPETPPVDITPDPEDQRRDFPSELDLYIKSTNYNVSSDNASYTIVFEHNGNKDIIELLQRTKDKRHNQIQKTLINHTKGVVSVEKLLDSVYITTDHMNSGFYNRNALNIGQGAYEALGAKGQYANMKIEIFFEDTKEITDTTGYKPGSRTLWVTIKRNN